MNGLALCSGYDGIGLGLSLVIEEYKTIHHVEYAEFPMRILRQRMTDGCISAAEITNDLRVFDGKPWKGKVDIVTAGYPCQYASSAARGRNVAENLWPHVARVINEIMPHIVFIENVSEHSILWACSCIEGMGYSTAFGMFSAEMVGAPHIRKRWFAVGYTNPNGESTSTKHDEVARMSSMEKTNSQWSDPPPYVRMGNGPSNRMDRLEACGNGVVPTVAALAFVQLAKCIIKVG